MNGTRDTADLLLGTFDELERESGREQVRQLIQLVSNNLGVFFLFVCLL